MTLAAPAAPATPKGVAGEGSDHDQIDTEPAAWAHDCAQARQTLSLAVRQLRAQQDRAGWWKGELATNVAIDAEDLLLREFLGIREPRPTRETARWIRSQQREDGTWSNFFGGPGDLSTTVEAYVALRLAGDSPQAPHLRAAATFIRRQGGVERTRVFTRIWLALFGLWSWRDLPQLPPEMIFLPRWCPLNIYDFACWARQTMVPLSVVTTLRPARRLPFGIDELRTGRRAPVDPLWTTAGLFQRADTVLHAYARRPWRGLRQLAMRRAAEWILARQEADGSWGGIQPPWVYSLLALHLLGYSLEHPVLRAGIAGLEAFTIRERTPAGWVRRIEACQSPVWDTALAVVALRDAGVAADDPALRRAGTWLLSQEVTVPGDWTRRRRDLSPGGWAFEFANDNYPDVDDTAEVVLALTRTDHHGQARPAIDRAVAWVRGMQSADGGWAAFDADHTRAIATRLPFCDFGAVTDPPSADVTAHAVEMLAARGLAHSAACRRAVRWLLAHQEVDGSWFGRWGANHIYGTGTVLPALIAAGVTPSLPAVRRAVSFLIHRQNPDGGWGEDLRSYRDPAWIGTGSSTASQTAWALLALMAAGEHGEVVAQGVKWLASTQRVDGTWDEPQFTGTGFPGDFYLNYHLYRLVFPICALGRYCATRDRRGVAAPTAGSTAGPG